jgi:hypothetical protein
METSLRKIKTAVIIQGKTICDNIQRLKEDWKDFQIIFSTWESDPIYCYDSNDVVIYNTIPEVVGVANINLQKVSSLNGFIRAKELGFERVIKWRYDLFPINTKMLVNFFDEDSLNFLTFHNHHEGYLVDYFAEGDVDKMISLFDVDIWVNYPEQAFIKKVFELGYDKNINFILKNLKENKVDIFWQKYNLFLSSYNNIEAFDGKIFKK